MYLCLKLTLLPPSPHTSQYVFSWITPPPLWACVLSGWPQSWSKSSKGNIFNVLFKRGVPHIINKASLGSDLNLLESVANVLKTAKFIAQLYCNRWSDMAVFNVFEMFSFKTGDSHVFSRSSIKVVEVFSVISNLSTTHMTIHYSRANNILKWICKLKQFVRSRLDLKITFSLQYHKTLSIAHLSLILNSSEILAKYGKTKVNSLLGTRKLRSFLINNLFKILLIHWFM